MNKNSKVITGIVVAGGLAALYFLVLKPKLMSTERAINIIIKKGYAENRTVLKTFGEDYLKAWGKAAQKEDDTFVYNGRTYLTQGGRAA